jgi:hypothetical protein
MPHFRLRTLLIVLALGPPVLAVAFHFGQQALHAYRERQRRADALGPTADLDLTFTQGTFTGEPRIYTFEPVRTPQEPGR